MDIEKLSHFKLAIIINTIELYEEARWLNRLRSYARAYALAHLGFEETAKLTVLLYIAMDIFNGETFSEEAIRKVFLSRLFTDHKTKLRLAFLRLPTYDFQETITQVNALNKIKNVSLYTDIFEDDLYKPSDFIGRSQSSSMINVLENTLNVALKEFGLKRVRQLKKVTTSQIEANFQELREGFVQTGTSDIADNYVDLLFKIVKNEQMYNNMKSIYIVKNSL